MFGHTFAYSTNTFGLPHSSQTPTIFLHPKNKYCKCVLWRRKFGRTKDKKIEIIEDVHVKHNPKQKEKEMDKKKQKNMKKHW